MRRLVPAALTAILAPCLLASGLARAQSAGAYDMALPADSAAACRGPLCLAWNPAGLAWGGTLEVAYLHHERWGQQFQAAGRADGLFISTPWVSASVQYLNPNVDDQARDYLKFDLALSAPLWDLAALAVGLSVLDPTETDADPAVDWFVGVMLRPWRYLSFGLVGRDLAEARLGGSHGHRSLDLSVAARPLWFAPETLTLAVDYRMLEDLGDPSIRFTAQAQVWEGLSLFASADLEGAFGFGLALDLPHLGVSGYTSFGGEEEYVNQGLVVGARMSLEPRPGFRVLHGQTAVIVLDGELADADVKRGLFSSRPTLYDAELALRYAARDEGVDSVLVRVEDVELGLTRVQELREACAAVRAAGKKLVFHLETATNESYYLAAGADRIFLSPGGSWAVTGPQVSALFLGGALTLVGGRAESVQAGKYKSAVEMFTREEPSPESREVLDSLADELADQQFTAIAEGRGLSREQVQQAVDEGLLTPEEALTRRLVDGIEHIHDLDAPLEKLLGHAPSYLGRYREERWLDDRWSPPPTIAVVHAQGSISYGQGGLLPGMPVRELLRTLRSLARDPEVEAVVLRIDSPGGSGLASELLWNELKRLREKKPLIVSMVGVAASGGYYIAVPAHAIVANPATLTGSIGVFSLLFDLSELAARLGVSQEVIGRGEKADLYSYLRGRTPEELARLQAVVDGFYKVFVDRVAEGRQLERTRVEEVAQGRVWTGQQARARGLVDELGGLHKALALARERIGLGPEDPVRLVHLPKARWTLMRLLGELGLGSTEAELLPESLRGALQQLAALAALSQEPALALLPWLSLQIR
ncbi:MAG TPA: signal peptide peptidase SppA [Myxococcota bacterium]|nr:signal peptide peptidase SppA [Myxococcota bacterium]HRY92060.1 signal peptide peptidase SppA [Myxococcota bacterium]HSA21444.1 signal peptide peptidase SppA [Myxococcota bacterium]